MERNKLQCIFVTNLLQIPADLLLDCRCCYYTMYGGEYVISWDHSWDFELSKYNKILRKSPFFIRQVRCPVSTETYFHNPLRD